MNATILTSVDGRQYVIQDGKLVEVTPVPSNVDYGSVSYPQDHSSLSEDEE